MLDRYILHNGEIAEATSAQFFAGQLGLLAGWGVFTTLKVIDGSLFAWDRHWARLTRDAARLNVAMPVSADVMESDLEKLIQANNQTGCTLRLVMVRNGGGMWEGQAGDRRTTDAIALTAASKQWPESVRLGIQKDARFAANEFAGVKTISWAANLTWAERAVKQGMDEVILLNEHGRVAECTSANVFAVFGDEAVTPPLSEGCLAGVTREILLELNGVKEAVLTVDDLYRADEVFITSTTRDLLRVEEIAGKKTGNRSVVRKRLSAEFQSIACATPCR